MIVAPVPAEEDVPTKLNKLLWKHWVALYPVASAIAAVGMSFKVTVDLNVSSQPFASTTVKTTVLEPLPE